MGRRRTVLSQVVAVLAALGAAPAGATPEITIATDDAFAPYSHDVGRTAAGLYPAIIRRAVARVGGWQVKIVPMPYRRALAESEHGDVDAVMPPYRLAARSWMRYYAGPLVDERIVAYCHNGSGLSARSRWPDDFRGRRIGLIRGFVLDDRLARLASSGVVELAEYRDSREGLAALAQRSIACFANEQRVVDAAYRQAVLDWRVAPHMPATLPAPAFIAHQGAYVAFSAASLARKPGLKAFALQLDRELTAMRANGEIDQLLTAFFNPTDTP